MLYEPWQVLNELECSELNASYGIVVFVFVFVGVCYVICLSIPVPVL